MYTYICIYLLSMYTYKKFILYKYFGVDKNLLYWKANKLYGAKPTFSSTSKIGEH